MTNETQKQVERERRNEEDKAGTILVILGSLFVAGLVYTIHAGGDMLARETTRLKWIENTNFYNNGYFQATIGEKQYNFFQQTNGEYRTLEGLKKDEENHSKEKISELENKFGDKN